jgi:hypothetical protein
MPFFLSFLCGDKETKQRKRPETMLPPALPEGNSRACFIMVKLCKVITAIF